ncbi:peroxiredoxin-like family protein [Postechiella marina]|uniref:Peroxiredoxin-like family protein n=1 Tax=Postechiella marina TaxID=943941 RepID=A0ABP8C3B8_9FLAO
MIKPNTDLPSLKLPLITDKTWELSGQQSETFTVLVFYRGLHCPVCKAYLEDLATKLKDFNKRGVKVIAISSDSEERAKKSGDTWNVPELSIAYNLTEDKARAFGLFISNGISDKEPNVFSEPGVFLVRPDNTLYASAIQTMPFARPNWNDILNAIDYINKNDYPARGGK